MCKASCNFSSYMELEMSITSPLQQNMKVQYLNAPVPCGWFGFSTETKHRNDCSVFLYVGH